MIEYQDFARREKRQKIDFNMPEKVKSINVTYDGGRLNIYINGVEAYGDMAAGDDFDVDIT